MCVCVCVSGKRQTAALQLLESERVYVSYLSLLLKANISFNGSEVLHAKDKRYDKNKQTHVELSLVSYTWVKKGANTVSQCDRTWIQY